MSEGTLEESATWGFAAQERAESLQWDDCAQQRYALLETDGEGKVLWTDSVFKEWTGFSLEELRGRDLNELLRHAETQAETPTDITSRIRAEDSFGSEAILVGNEGSLHWVQVEAESVRDPQGQRERFAVKLWDLAHRQESEDRLREEIRFHSEVGEMAKVGGWEVDWESKALRWTQMIRKIHEVPEDYVPELKAAFEFYPPEARALLQNLADRAIHSGEGFDVDLPLRTAKGRQILVRVMGKAKLKANGAKALYGSIQDITDRKREQEKLSSTNARLRALLAAVPDYLLQVRKDGLVLDFQPGDDANPGFPLHGAVGKRLEAKLPPEAAYPVLKAMKAATESLDLQVVEFDLRIGAKRHFFEARVIPTQANDLLMLIREVTERKEAEQAAQALLEEVAEAKTKAEGANRAKSQFLAVMSHEIRTPMNAIIGMTRLLLDSGVSGEQREMAETVMRSGEALLDIVNDILDFSKIEAGKVELENIEFNLEQTMEDTVDLMQAKAQEKGIELIYYFDPQLSEIRRGDPARLRQMVLNLLSNAIKFTSEGYVFLRVVREGPTALRIDVEDTGIGVALNKQAILFQRFSQADSSTTRRFGGTGLGLAIVRELAELMGGAISMESKEGEGSTFTLRLPGGGPSKKRKAVRRRPAWVGPEAFQRAGQRLWREFQEKASSAMAGHLAEQEEILSEDVPRPIKGGWLRERLNGDEHARQPRPLTAPDQLARFDGKRVLLVEDNAVNQKVGVRMLEKLGCRVDVAGNGFEAVQMVGQLPYDLVLMDCQMPEMDGFQASRQIRSLGAAAKKVSIVALTAAATQEDREQCLSAGMNDYLTKPVSLADLAKALETWSARSRGLAMIEP